MDTNEQRTQNTRWYNVLTVVDIETGEILPKREVELKNYRIINKSHTYENQKEYNIKRTTWECKRHEQQKLF